MARNIIITGGTSVLRAVRSFFNPKTDPFTNSTRDALFQKLRGLEKPDDINDSVNFLRVCFGASGDEDELTDALAEKMFHTHITGDFERFWPLVPELRALRAANGVPGGEGAIVTFLTADARDNRWAAQLLRPAVAHMGSEASFVEIPGMGDRATFTQNELARASDLLVELLQDAVQPHGRPMVFITGGTKPLVSLVTLLCEQLSYSLYILSGNNEDLSLLDMTVDVPAELTSVNAGKELAAISRRVRDWANRPAEIKRADSKCSINVATEMVDRTTAWLEGNPWQGDRLIHMMKHDAGHGRRVDSISNDLLHRMPFMAGLPRAEYEEAVQALHAASFLHDTGQRGGLFCGRYLVDHEHLRMFHGAVSEQLVNDEHIELKLPLKLAKLTGYLCRCHQRTAVLTDNADRWIKGAWPAEEKLRLLNTKRKVIKCPDKRDDCPYCARAIPLLQPNGAQAIAPPTLEELVDRHWGLAPGAAFAISGDTAVRLAAVLRVADAADLSRDRVDGRWGQGMHSIEKSWRRDYLVEQRTLLSDAEDLGDVDRALHRIIDRGRFDTDDLTDLQVALEACKRHAKVHAAAADRFWNRVLRFRDYLVAQAEYAKKHQSFSSCQVLADQDHKSVRLHLHTAPGTDPSLWKNQVDVALAYVWSEYLDSEYVFEDDAMWRLTSVSSTSPDGMQHQRTRKDAEDLVKQMKTAGKI